MKRFESLRRRALTWIMAAGALAWAPYGALAQPDAFPSKPVRIIVAFPAGGTADVMARIVSENLSRQWEQPVVIENRVGAGGNIGAAAVYNAAPDGYTLLMTATGPLSINQFLYPSIAFTPERFAPISVLAAIPNAVTVRDGLPAKNLQELIAYGRSHPGKLVYVSAGQGSTQHLSGQLLASLTGIEMVHVPYSGEGPALNDLLAGRVDVFVGNISATLKHQGSGRLRILALASPKRSASAPDLPTTAEAGLPALVASSWFAIAAPPGTPEAVLGRLSEGIGKAMQDPEVRQKIQAQGAELLSLDRAQSERFIADERQRWKKVIESAHIRLE